MIIEEKICGALRDALEELDSKNFTEALKSVEYAQGQIQEPQQKLQLAVMLIKEAVDIEASSEGDMPMLRDTTPQLTFSKQLITETLNSGWWKSWA